MLKRTILKAGLAIALATTIGAVAQAEIKGPVNYVRVIVKSGV